MAPDKIEALRAKYLDAQYWPWPLAFAYCQTSDVRMASVDAAIEVLETYPAEKMVYAVGYGAVARAYAIATGKCHAEQPVEKVAFDGEPWTVKTGEQVYWEQIAEIELPLLDAIKTDRLVTWGRAAPQARLNKLDATDWVGCEVDPAKTCDLVKAGWRVKASDLSAVLGEVERQPVAYDIHLFGAAVRQFVEAYDNILSDGDGPIFNDWENSDRTVREGYWSLFATGAWIASRDDKFVAAVQEYEEAALLDRGGVYSGGGWLFLGDLMGEHFGMTLTDATVELREALETGRLQGGVGREVNSRTRPVERHEWKDWAVAHDHRGMASLPGVYDVAWPSEFVRDAFPFTGLKSNVPTKSRDKRATLPATAKPNDRKYEEDAHKAAELVRAGGVSKQRAFEKVAPIVEMRNPDSVVRAIRHSYDLMYDERGEPIKN